MDIEDFYGEVEKRLLAESFYDLADVSFLTDDVLFHAVSRGAWTLIFLRRKEARHQREFGFDRSRNSMDRLRSFFSPSKFYVIPKNSFNRRL